MNRGCVKLWRNIEDTGVLECPHALQVYVYLLMNVSRTERKVVKAGRVFKVGEGEIVTSVAMICEKLKLSVRECRTAISTLKKLDLLTSRTTNKGTAFCIVNWDTYQQEHPEMANMANAIFVNQEDDNQ